jgi:uncharacterized SAM-binding protein YcdF (DUF218 family)
MRARHSFVMGISLLAALFIGARATAVILIEILIPRALSSALEERFERTSVQDWSAIEGVVVLGGSRSRVSEALRLAQLHSHLRVVITGPSTSEATLALNAPGVGSHRITIEDKARDTYGNARHTKALLMPAPDDRWLLITSAAHLPRAIGSFYRVGFPVDPWPIRDDVQAGPSRFYAALHEWLGLAAYWLSDKTVALFPGNDNIRDRQRMKVEI